ncbi:MAG TPA: HisA/HisF-related TIM barrel protein [Acidimicrobiia bacterium]|nr:HisA/HisF-related TIM barrel protein [Acidimicrobiia bacterium]
MDLYARINLLDGRAVRLPKGDVRDAIALDADPVGRASSWVEQGADRIHIVDLDAAAYGDYGNRPLIERIISNVEVPVQVAGGIRSPGEVERVLGYGANRVIIGTAAVEDQVLVWELCRAHAGRIVVSLDVRPDEEIAIRGWLVDSGVFLEQALIDLSSAGVAAFLVGEAGRDALTSPSNYGILRRALSLADEPIIAAGGAMDMSDLRSLTALEEKGRRLDGIIVGREVTEGRFTMDEACQVLRSSDGD